MTLPLSHSPPAPQIGAAPIVSIWGISLGWPDGDRELVWLWQALKAGDVLQLAANKQQQLVLLPESSFPSSLFSVLGKLSVSFCSEQQVKFPLCEHKAAKAENKENKVKKTKIKIPDGSFQARNSAEHSHTRRRSSGKHRLCWGRHPKGHFTSCLRSTTCFKIPRCLCWVFIPKSCFAYEFQVDFFGALR